VQDAHQQQTEQPGGYVGGVGGEWTIIKYRNSKGRAEIGSRGR